MKNHNIDNTRHTYFFSRYILRNTTSINVSRPNTTLLSILLFFMAFSLSAQFYIGGSGNVTLGSNGNGSGIYFINGGSVSSVSWYVKSKPNGAQNPSIATPNGNQTSIEFYNAGIYAIQATVNNNNTTQEFQVIVSNPPPSNPNNPTVSAQSCGQATLSRSGNPPSGVRWYWQGKTSNGFITNKGYGSTFLANEGTGTYYIRARNTSTGVWSSGLGSVTVTINNSTSTPSASNKTICEGGSTFLTASGVSGNPIYKWYNSSNGLLGTGATYGTGTLNSPGNYTYRVSATVNGCESAKRTVTVTVTPGIDQRTLTTPAEGTCVNQSGQITMVGSQSGVRYQLKKGAQEIGSFRTSNGPDIIWGTNISAGTYYVEAYYADGSCTPVNTNSVTVITKSAKPLRITTSPTNYNAICPDQGLITLFAQDFGPLGIIEWLDENGNTLGSSTSQNVSPPAGGTTTYTLRAYDDCDEIKDKTINLTVLPALGTISIDPYEGELCVNPPNTDYNASTSNASGYSWRMVTPGAGTINTSTGTVNWNNSFSGTATIEVTAIGSCGTEKTRTFDIEIVDPPQIYTLNGPTEICANRTDSITLSDSEPGVDYQLYKDNSTTGIPVQQGTGEVLTWSNINSGSTYRVEASNGICSSIPMAGVLNIGTKSGGEVRIGDGSPIIENICPGQAFTLATNGSNAVWSTGDTGTTTSVTLSAGSSQVVTVEAEDLCGITQPAQVTLRAMEAIGTITLIGPTSRCEGAGGYDYGATVSNANEFDNLTYSNWSVDPPNAVSNINANTGDLEWNATYSGPATIQVTVNNGCQTKDADFPITVTAQIPFYLDADNDGFAISILESCSNPGPGYTANVLPLGDCDDDDIHINPDSLWMHDEDDDTYKGPNGYQVGCTPPNDNYDDYTLIIEENPEARPNDCDDTDPSILGAQNWWFDGDNDDFPLEGSFRPDCQNPGLGTPDEAKWKSQPYAVVDCDDTDPTITAIKWYVDADGDDLGEPDGDTDVGCQPPNDGRNWVDNNDDPCPGDSANFCSNYPCGETFESDMLTGDNYVYSRTYQEPSNTQIDPGFFTENDSLIQSITYFDGLGRAIQQIGLDHSPNKNDIVSHMAYDDFGRMPKEWLPVPTTDGNLGTLRLGIENTVEEYYNAPKYENTLNPFSEKGFEASPLNRVEQQAAPGNDWALGQGHEIGFGYETNTIDDGVKLFYVTTSPQTTASVITYTPTLEENAEYPAGELYKNVTFDENHTSGKNHTTEEFADKNGQVVLKRTYADMNGASEVPHDTYYVYDDYGNLTYVLPPKVDVDDGVSTEELAALCYQYTYDNRNRLVVKQLPGKGEEYIVYNSLDQPILTQDANMRAVNNTNLTSDEWLFTKYDPFGRVAYTGMLENNGSRIGLQNDVNNSVVQTWVDARDDSFVVIDNTNVYYSNDGYPASGYKELHTVNYYDTYNTVRDGMPVTASAFGLASTTKVQGLATVNLVKVLGTNDFITTAVYYDDKARPIFSHSKNDYLNTVDIVASQLDFIGRPTKVKTTHTREGNTIVTIDNFTYDHIGRLLAQTQCIGDGSLGDSCPTNGVPADIFIENETVTNERVATNSITTRPVTTISGTATLRIDPNATGGSGNTGSELIVYNDYDELGQLQAKKVGGTPSNSYVNTTGLQTVDYNYNVRGWLTSINNGTASGNDLFGYNINYNTVEHGGTPLFNGNIAETSWATTSINNTSNPVSDNYRYLYDALNRITSATDNTGNYNVTGIAYDKNGNIQSLNRNGWQNSSTFTDMDILDYDYQSNTNKLLKVTDVGNKGYGFKEPVTTGDDYRYDPNGNLVMDRNKGIGSDTVDGIEYNHLNLPTQVTFNNGNIQYVYAADGTKLKKIVSTGSVTEYTENHVYSGNATSTELQFFNHPEGYTTPDGQGGYDYVYQYKDHLGNVRLSYAKDPSNPGSPTIIKENNYYPFGLTHRGYNSGGDTSLGNDFAERWKYNEKEFDESLGLDWYDFGARNYEPSLGRWMNIDNLAEKMFAYSPYNYTLNNPIYFIDPDGNAPANPLRNIMGLVDPSTKQWVAAINAAFQGNENWHIIKANNATDLADKIDDYLGDTKADNIVIRSHGARGQLNLVDGESQLDEADQVRNEGMSSSDAITSSRVFDYVNLEQRGGGNFNDYYSEALSNSLNALTRIGKKVRDEGNLIFTACRAGADEGSLGKNLQVMLGERFNIFLNTRQSKSFRISGIENGEPFYHILDSPLQDINSPGGFIKVTPDRQVIKLGNTLQFNSRGKPVTIVPENDPIPVKKD